MTTSLKHAAFLTALTFSLSGFFQALGSTLYSQNLNTGSASAGLTITNAVAADSFSLATAGTVRSVSFHTLECCYLTWTGTISYFLFTGSNSPGSTPFAQGSTTSYLVNNVYSDSASNAVNDYEFNLTTPVSLSANTTYWLGLEMSPGGSGPGLALFGSGITYRSTSGSPYSWGGQYGSGAFGLFDTTFQTTPEPGSPLLIGTGLGFVCVGLRRRKAAQIAK